MMDFANCLYEVLGGLFVSASIIRICRDKCVRGVSVWHVLYFTTWGFFNLFFYPSIGAPISAIGASCVALANTVWLVMICYYLRAERNAKR